VTRQRERQFLLRELACEDAHRAHQRPKIEDYEGMRFLVLLDKDIDEVEHALFSTEGDATERIYFLKREVIEFHHAVRPLLGPLADLERGAFPEVTPQIQSYFRGVNDHVKRVAQEVDSQRELLTSILQASLALVAVRQSEVVRKISGWAAVIAVPTFIASVYGMNFDSTPEPGWGAGYALVWAAMLIACLLLAYFK